MVMFVSNQTSAEKNQSTLLEDTRIIIKNPQVWLSILYFTGVFGSVLSFSNIYSISFQTLAFGRSVAHVVPITGTVILGVSIGSIIAGILVKKLGDYTRIAKVFPSVSLICFFIILFFRFDALYFEEIGLLVYSLFGFGLGGFVMAFQCVQENIADENLRPLASSFVLTVSYIFVGFVEQPVVGAILSHIKTTAIELPHSQYFLDFSVHDEFYRYSMALSFVLAFLAIAVISSFFFKSQKSSD
jgi:nitrate/nitrite transporter NarK